MGTFNTHRIINADPSLIPAMADKIINYFSVEGYDVDLKPSEFGTYDISLTKGGVFRTVLGLRTALKVTIRPEAGRVSFDAGIGIFGQQLIPTAVMWFVAWPVIITQIWGMVKQSNLDDKALKLAESVVPAVGAAAPTAPAQNPSSGDTTFCPNCGGKHDAGMKFCPYCGSKL